MMTWGTVETMATPNRSKENQAAKVEILRIIRAQEKEIQSALTEFAEQAILMGGTQSEIRQKVKNLAARLTELLNGSITLASGAGLKRMTTLGKEYLKKTDAITGGKTPGKAKIMAEWGGGLNEKVLNQVWSKVWEDGKSLKDRVERVSASVSKNAEKILKDGIKEGLSSRDIAKKMNIGLGIEKKAAFRLAVHSTNTAYHEAAAEVSMRMSFIMGIRIIRGMYGNASDQCDICEEHGGPADGSGFEYRKSDFGGRDMDLFVMTNSPQYHPNCNCGIEYLEMDAADFVEYAREKYGNGGGKKSA